MRRSVPLNCSGVCVLYVCVCVRVCGFAGVFVRLVNEWHRVCTNSTASGTHARNIHGTGIMSDLGQENQKIKKIDHLRLFQLNIG